MKWMMEDGVAVGVDGRLRVEVREAGDSATVTILGIDQAPMPLLVERAALMVAGRHQDPLSLERALRNPLAPDASDETRLAAGWCQQLSPIGDGMVRPTIPTRAEPVPGPAGAWRLHASGLHLVRWLRPRAGSVQ